MNGPIFCGAAYLFYGLTRVWSSPADGLLIMAAGGLFIAEGATA